MSIEQKERAVMKEAHNSHVKSDLPLSGGEGDIREVLSEIVCIWDGLQELREIDQMWQNKKTIRRLTTCTSR